MVTRRALISRLLILGLLATSTAFAVGVKEEVLSFTTHDDLTIQCVLSYPDHGEGPFPGMLLIPGNGLHDADVTIDVPTLGITQGPQTLFKPLAQSFSRRGWAVQRCNKRGASFGHTDDRPWILESSTLQDLIEDARSALAALHRHRRVAASPLVVLGHSEGALIATRLAEEHPEVDLLVLMGGVGRRFDALIEYQLVDRNLVFLRQAADANRDGSLTLEELNLLDGNYGMESVYVFNSASILFQTIASKKDGLSVRGFNPRTDLDGDGQLHIDREIEPAIRQEAERFLDLARDGLLGRYWQSLVDTPAPTIEIQRVTAPILFVHGALDVQSPLEEPLTMMARLESFGRQDYEILFFPALGHSLAKPNDFYKLDGGLTILDNLTLDAPRLKTLRQILRKIEEILAE